MSKTDKAISIYQTYTLAKISALTKKSVTAQYAQCAQIDHLEKGLRSKLSDLDRTNQRILDAQIKEAKRKEAIRHYRALAFSMKEAVKLIDDETDLLFKAFLLELYGQPIGLYLRESKQHLDEIPDMEFCSQVEHSLKNIQQEVSEVTDEYMASSYHKLLVENKPYMEAQQVLEEQQKTQSRAEEIPQPEYETPLSLKAFATSKYNTGCFIAILVLSISIYCANIADSSEVLSLTLVWVVVPLCLVAVGFWRNTRFAKKKAKGYDAYLASIAQKNEAIKQSYEAKVRERAENIERLNQQENYLEHQHPYVLAKNDIAQRRPDWEDIIEAIGNLISQQTGNAAKEQSELKDPLLYEAAKFVVSCGVATTSSLQRRYSIGYNRAGKIMDLLEACGVVGKSESGKPRRILVDEAKLNTMFQQSSTNSMPLAEVRSGRQAERKPRVSSETETITPGL